MGYGLNRHDLLDLIGHTSGVVSIHFIDRFLASGSVDGIVRVWNLQAGSSFTLVGHSSWVNKVKILDCKTQLLSCSDDGKMVCGMKLSSGLTWGV